MYLWHVRQQIQRDKSCKVKFRGETIDGFHERDLVGRMLIKRFVSELSWKSIAFFSPCSGTMQHNTSLSGCLSILDQKKNLLRNNADFKYRVYLDHFASVLQWTAGLECLVTLSGQPNHR